MEVDTRDKLNLIAAALLAVALLSALTMSAAASAYLLLADDPFGEDGVAASPSTDYPAPDLPYAGPTITNTAEAVVGLWSGPNDSFIMFGPIEANAPGGYFNSSVDGKGAWTLNDDGVTVVVLSDSGMHEWNVSFSGANTMVLRGLHVAHTWNKIADIY